MTSNLSQKMSDAKRMNLESFSSEVAKGNECPFTLTSNLVRCKSNVMSTLYSANLYETITSDAPNKPFGAKLSSTCVKCRSKRYGKAPTVQVPLIQMKSAQLTADGSDDKLAKGTPKDSSLTSNQDSKSLETEATQASTQPQNIYARHTTEYLFKPTANTNYVLNLIRKLANCARMTEEAKSNARSEVTSGLSLNVIRMLCAEVMDIFMMEARVLKISSPCYVMGDTHGNINDLLTFENLLWVNGPVLQGKLIQLLNSKPKWFALQRPTYYFWAITWIVVNSASKWCAICSQ